MKRSLTLVLAGCLALLSCGRPARPPATGKPGVFVSILPQAYLVERIAGDRVSVDVLVGPGQSPHTYTPTAEQMIRLADAKAYFTIGLPFEQVIVKKIQDGDTRLKIVDMRRGIKLRNMAETDEGHDEDSKSGDHDHEHAAGVPDPHIWLDPKLLKTQAATICDALCELDPANADDYRENLKALQDDLDKLDARIAKVLAPLKGKEFFVFHPAFGYFGDAYGLKQVAIEMGGKSPGAKHLENVIDQAKKKNVRVIFVQKQFSSRSAQAIAEQIHGAVVSLDPLDKDLLGNLERMANEMETALK